MAGKGGGAWKVAYADFVTAMMAFFMVMWLVGQKQDVKEAIAKHFSEPHPTPMPAWIKNLYGKYPKPTPKSDSMKVGTEKQGSDVDGRGSGNPGTKTVEVPEGSSSKTPKLFRQRQGVRSSVGSQIYFVEDTAELDPAAVTRLKNLAPTIVGKPNKIEIRGHALRKPLPQGSPYKDAWELSFARSLATMRCLIECGVEPDRFRLSQAGANEPLTIDTAPELQSRNSSVELFLLDEYVGDLIGTKDERTRRFDDNAPAVE